MVPVWFATRMRLPPRVGLRLCPRPSLLWFALQMASTDSVMEEISLVSEQFAPFAAACSRTFFSLQQLPQLHFLYQVSLSAFLSLVDGVLGTAAPGGGGSGAGAGAASGSSSSSGSLALGGVQLGGDAPELPSLIQGVIQQVFAHVGPGLLHEHKLVLALRLVQVSLGAVGAAFDDPEADLLFRGAGHVEPDPRHLATVQSTLAGEGHMSASQVKVR